MLLPLHPLMDIEWVAVPRPDTHRTLISLGAVVAGPLGGAVQLRSGRCLDSCSAAFHLVGSELKLVPACVRTRGGSGPAIVVFSNRERAKACVQYLLLLI